MDIGEQVTRKFKQLSPTMSERARRLWVGAEADALGRGGVAAVARATGMAISTVRKGRDEVRAAPLEVMRDRRPGGGRRRLEKKNPALTQALEKLISPATRGDPESALRWTAKSAASLAEELSRCGHRVSGTKVRRMLTEAGYSLQAAFKVKEGKSHPDRDAQFEYIDEKTKAFLAEDAPVISVDTKKKELVGDHFNAGREWQPKGEPVEVLTYDFASRNAEKAVPYGVYDVGRNHGFVNVGTDHDTPMFAVHSIERWWDLMGRNAYPQARKLFVTADAGGSNSARSHVWKNQLQAFADRNGLTIHVSHFPPGTSKWNKIEHRLFSFITLNWRGRPLASYETIVALIGATRTTKGLTVTAELDRAKYPLGISVERREFRALNVIPDDFQGMWNYVLRPRTEAELAAARAAPPHQTRGSHVERNARWKPLIVEQLASGFTAKRFCRERGLNYSAFYAARRRHLGKLGETGKRAPRLIRRRTPDTE